MRCLGVQIAGGKIDVDEYGDPIIGDCMLILFNADHARGDSVHAAGRSKRASRGRGCSTRRSTSRRQRAKTATQMTESVYKLQPCSMVVFSSPVPEVEEQPVLEAGKEPQTIATEVPAATK